MPDFTPFSVSVMLTKAEYVNEAARQALKVGPITYGGLALVLVGLACRLFSWGTAFFGMGVLTLGALLVLFEQVFRPQNARVAAAGRFDTARPEALTLTLSPTEIQVAGRRVNGRLPLSALTRFEEADALFLLGFGAELTLYIPRRLLTEDQETAVRTLACLKE